MNEETSIKKAESKASDIILTVVDNKMSVIMSCTIEVLQKGDFIDTLKDKLRFMKITARPDIVAIEEEVKQARDEERGISSLKIASGTPPVKPVDGRIEWTRDYFRPGYYIDPVTKKIDFHQKLSDPCVEKDEILVKMYRAKMGKNGKNVFGQAITVPNPREVILKPGNNVYWDEEVTGFRAACPGTVQKRGYTIEVNDVFTARNGVNTEIGNIKHNGKVVVNGDIDSDFRIEATGDVEVKGLVYASDIICGGNLITREGINSSSDKLIKVEGDILTKYIQNANVEAHGNITANSEIYQCQIYSDGEVNVNEGRIVGGEIFAVHGISVGEAGSKGSINTVLISGVDRVLQAKLKTNHEDVKQLKETIKKLDVAYRKLKRNIRILNDDQIKTMAEIKDELKKAEVKIEQLNNDNKNLYEEKKQKEEATIHILNLVYPGTILRIGDCRHRVDHILLGPIYASYDRDRDEIKLSSD
ncbi:MAG: FapA family protein [Candidatus Zixiibacteriota bacterium]